VTYFCFIESDILSAPQLEPLTASDLDGATREAEALLARHAGGYAAHVLLGEDCVATIRRGED
jgi:hypothetical protein